MYTSKPTISEQTAWKVVLYSKVATFERQDNAVDSGKVKLTSYGAIGRLVYHVFDMANLELEVESLTEALTSDR